MQARVEGGVIFTASVFVFFLCCVVFGVLYFLFIELDCNMLRTTHLLIIYPAHV